MKTPSSTQDGEEVESLKDPARLSTGDSDSVDGQDTWRGLATSSVARRGVPRHCSSPQIPHLSGPGSGA